MGSNQSVLKDNGYTIVGKEGNTMLAKNEGGDLFSIKQHQMMTKTQGDQTSGEQAMDQQKRQEMENSQDISHFLQEINHPHIVHLEKIIPDGDCVYLVLEHCEGGNLAQTIQLKKEKSLTFYEILDWTLKICMALKYLHDQEILHKNLQPKSIFFTAHGTIRLGEFGKMNEWTADTQTETENLSYVAPEILNGKEYDEKSEIWSLGCIIYEMCMLKCAFTARGTQNIIAKILTCSYEELPKTFSADLRQLVKDTLQINPEKRPSVSEILTRPFVLKHLYKKSEQTIEELKERKPKSSETTPRLQDSQEKSNNSKVSLKVLEELADSLETVHYNTTVGSLAGGVVGLAGGITSVVGLILAPFTLGASLIVTGVGIGVGVAGGVTAGASNITKMVNQRSNRQNIKMIIREIQEKITSTSFCIQNIQVAVKYLQNEFTDTSTSFPKKQPVANNWANAGARLGRGLGGVAELVRLTQVANIGKVAAQTARVARVAEAATGVLSGLFVAVDVFFIALDAKEIHKLRQDYASIEAKNKLSTTKKQELQSEIMKFVKKIRETTDKLETILDELKKELMQTNKLN